MNGTELKPRSLRLDDVTFDKIKQLAASISGNQQQAMSVLLSAYETQMEKGGMPEEADLIERYEEYQNVMHALFMDALKAKRDAKELARSTVELEMKSKDQVIMELQERVKVAEQKELRAKADVEPLEKKNKELSVENDRIKKEFEFAIKEKMGAIESLEEKLTQMSAEIESLKKKDSETRAAYEENVKVIMQLHAEMDELRRQEQPLKDNVAKLKMENMKLSADGEKLKEENSDLQKVLADTNEKKDAEISMAVKQAVIDTKEEMLAINEKEREKAEEYRDKYFRLLEEVKKQ